MRVDQGDLGRAEVQVRRAGIRDGPVRATGLGGS
jgi:hypothetical protein